MTNPRKLILVWGLLALGWIAVAYALFRHAQFHNPDIDRNLSIALAVTWPLVFLCAGVVAAAKFWPAFLVGYLFLGALWGAIDHFLDALGSGIRFWSATLVVYVVFYAFCWPVLLHDRLRYGR